MSKIKEIISRQILDSRGNPTVEVDVITEDGVIGRAAVPSGASTGAREALELRDKNDNYYLGKSVLSSLKNIQEKIKPLLIGKDVFSQKEIDYLMIELDGTDFKSNLGANSILAVSMAVSRAGANSKGKSLYKYLREDLACPTFSEDYVLPTPMMNIINGGEHASNNLDIQEFMILPKINKPFSENLRAGVEIFHHLKKVLTENKYSTNVGDEGGFAPNLESHDQALELISKSIEKAGYKLGEEIVFALDSAASEFYEEDKYKVQGQNLNSVEMIQYYEELVNKFPIYSIEDGLAEGDNEGWKKLTSSLTEKCLLVGDDLFVTNKKIFQQGIEDKLGNSILIKVNQIGTVTETFETIDLAIKKNYKAIISHRSGETGDHFIADLAVATSCGFIKTGSASRSDRLEKYNQLLRIEEELGDKAVYRSI